MIRLRRRRPRLRTVAPPFAVVAVLAVAAIAAGVAVVAVVATAGNDGGTLSASGSKITTLGLLGRRGAVATATSKAEQRRLAQDSAAVSSVLRYTPFLASGVARRRMIALTFDDGPSPYTPQIIRVLVRMHVPATFFIVGLQLKLFGSSVRDELQHGFTIGDHTQNHPLLSRLRTAGQSKEISAAAVGVQRLGAPPPRLFRPPYGMYNRQTISILRSLKMLMVMWSIDPGDWRRPGVGPIVNGVLGNARPGAIVILHDGGGDRSQTVAALPAIVNGLRKRHYELVSVPQLAKSDPPPRGQRLPHISGV